MMTNTDGSLGARMMGAATLNIVLHPFLTL